MNEHIEEAEVLSQGIPRYNKDPEIKSKFKPNANYQWQPDDKFELSGGELNVLHNTLHLVFNDSKKTQPQIWVMLSKLYELTSELIKKGVEDGIIQEVEPPKLAQQGLGKV